MKVNSWPTFLLVIACIAAAVFLIARGHDVPGWLVGIIVAIVPTAAGSMQPAFRRLRARTILPAKVPEPKIEEKKEDPPAAG